MTPPIPVASPNRPLLVSDFDGTMTARDFFWLAVAELVPADMPDYWAEYRARRITHFDGLRLIFGSIRADRRTVEAVVDRMELDPNLATALGWLERAGWEVVVASAGCRWYIDRLLEAAGARLTVYANPGHFEEGRGLVMRRPDEAWYACPELGVDKAAVVRAALEAGRKVAFAGDGFPDASAARLVPPELCFARRDLAEKLGKEGRMFRTYDCWADVARQLTASTNAPST